MDDVDTDLTLDGLDFDDLTASGPTTFRSAAVDVIAAAVTDVTHSPEADEPARTSMVFDSPGVIGWTRKIGVFDLETTGIDPETARIVSAHVGVLDAEGNSISRRDWLADPGVEIPAGAAAIHGITTERARSEGRSAPEVVEEIVAELCGLVERGIPIVIYNAPYDLTLLRHETRRHDLGCVENALVIDPLVIDKGVDKFRRGKRTLTAASEFYGVPLEDAHDSAADAIAAGRVALALARRYPEYLDVSLEELHAMQVAWCREQTESFVEYMRRREPDFTKSGDWPERLAVAAATESGTL